MDMNSKRESAGKRPACRSRRHFLAWSALALLSFLLGRRRRLKELPGGEAALPGREARYYRRIG
jgi:hypothetical protein